MDIGAIIGIVITSLGLGSLVTFFVTRHDNKKGLEKLTKQNGKVNFTYNGIVYNENGWWVVVDGKVDFDYNGLAKRTDNGTWWMIQAGKVDFDFNGIACNQYGFWVVENGKVNFDYNGSFRFSGIDYKIQNGKVV